MTRIVRFDFADWPSLQRELAVPKSAVLLHCAIYQGMPSLWFSIDDNAHVFDPYGSREQIPNEPAYSSRCYVMLRDGETIPHGAKYIMSVHEENTPIMYHLCER